jgi:hypothetical protein
MTRWIVFPALGALAVGSSIVELLSGTPGQSIFAVAVLLPMVVGVVVGATAVGETRPDVVLAKLCAVVILAGFAVSPLGIDVVAAEFGLADPGAGHGFAGIGLTLGIAVFAGLLFVLPGAGVSLLIGIGVGLLSVYDSGRTNSDGAAAVIFVGAFLCAWVVLAFIRSALPGSRRTRT